MSVLQELQRVGLDRALVPRHDCGSVYIRESVYGSEIKLDELGKINSDQEIWEKASRVQVAKTRKWVYLQLVKNLIIKLIGSSSLS